MEPNTSTLQGQTYTPPPAVKPVAPSVQQQAPPTQSGDLDYNAKALTKAIALQENGGKPPTPESYMNKGKSGERGLYQFTKPTWQNYAGQILGNSNADPTPENQNQVAYGKVKQWMQKGKTPEQIASMWNAGEGAPDASSTGLVGTNNYGQRYDVKAYANGVLKNYHPQLKEENIKEQQQDPSSFLGKVIDFAFPIIKDVNENIKGTSKKSALQQLGDLGLSAMWFVPGAGELVAGNLLGEAGAKTLGGKILGGAVTGYGTDVASKLSEGETDVSKLATPGLGTAIGGGVSGLLGKVSSRFNQENVLKNFSEKNNSVFGQWKGSANDLAEAFSKGKDPGTLAAKKGINILDTINPETVAYETKPLAQKVSKDARALDEVLEEALGGVQGTVSINDVEKKVIDAISSKIGEKIKSNRLANYIKPFFDEARQAYGNEVNLGVLNKIKGTAWADSVFDVGKLNDQRYASRLIGNTLKKEIERIAEENGVKGVGEFNEYIGSHYNLADMLEGINGNKAKGGRLGDMLQKHALGTTAGLATSMFGGGVPGALMAFLAGEYVSPKISNLMRKLSASPLKKAILNRMVQEDPEIVQKMLQKAKQTPQALKAIKEFLDKQGVKNELPNSPLAGKLRISPELNPKVSQPNKLEGLVSQGLVRGAQILSR